ncbi:MAG: tRNA lysidine(34) synthetase TilS [Clostridiales bacterium GWE2_32_10]|nr:MAG: tRNA lysidine(34) synthetase TilS [Clostridiales bacterium GWE2_32_10]HBY21706.1 tRNA lysidine(34) synthetase TilS [Clostridiales bacterium]
MIDKVKRTIQKYTMIKKGDKIVVGVSGGADSMSLLNLLIKFKNEYNIEIIVVHINHGIRGSEADRDEHLVKKYCDDNDILVYIFKTNVAEHANKLHITIEEAGRELRYEKFKEILKKENANKIAIAHNKNDSVETVFINMIRGTGLKGLLGIGVVNGDIIRPLIECDRHEIELYCTQNNIDYIVDSTNNENIYTRNKIRNELIPYIKENLSQRVIDNIFRMTTVLSKEDTYLDKEAFRVYAEAIKKCREYYVDIDLKKLILCDEVIAKRVVRKALYEIAANRLKDINYEHINDIFNLIYKQSGKKINLPNNIVVERSFDVLKISLENTYKEEEYEYKINKFPCSINIEENKFTLELIDNLENIINTDNVKYFDFDKINIDDLRIRNRREGDYIYLKSDKERQKLKKFFINNKISKEERNKLPILVQNNNVLWIVGYKVSPFFAPAEKARKVVRIEKMIDQN